MERLGLDPDTMPLLDNKLESGDWPKSGVNYGKDVIPVVVGKEFLYQFEDTRRSQNSSKRQRWSGETDANGNQLPPFVDATKDTFTLTLTNGDTENPKPLRVQDVRPAAHPHRNAAVRLRGETAVRELHAWENGHHVGVFSEDDEERISFAYDANEGLPISLSLPRTGGWRDQAPRNFLDNLLPDNPNVRQAMREHLNASSAGVFDLLDRVDATGGLVFSLSPEPPIPSPTLRLISDSQIANEIDRIERTRNYWWDEDSHCRFSLGGAQGKFTLSRVDGKWYWPDMMLPSTHIVKPKPHDLPEATKVELATMRLSELCGIDTPARGEITAQRKTAYIVERFDRRLEEGRIVRLRQEDFLQALGLPTRDKYDPSADDCLDLLQRIDASGSLSYRWLERLAFNTSSANSDAHAKTIP